MNQRKAILPVYDNVEYAPKYKCIPEYIII